ncbi:hypothetical protein FTX61_18385 [Nitriliruptoraceae bacterium ZYF776]|nr:hypothetical protein [Profundirhabdus halotolerans]
MVRLRPVRSVPRGASGGAEPGWSPRGTPRAGAPRTPAHGGARDGRERAGAGRGLLRQAAR